MIILERIGLKSKLFLHKFSSAGAFNGDGSGDRFEQRKLIAKKSLQKHGTLKFKEYSGF